MMRFEQLYFNDLAGEISNYRNYTARKYADLAHDLLGCCMIDRSDTIIDFGCATGALMKQFIQLGYENVYGTDISYWAVDYGKRMLSLGDHIQYLNMDLLSRPKDFVLMLDVLEHVPSLEEIRHILNLAGTDCRKAIVIRVPVSRIEGEDFYLAVSRNDKTHVQCHSALFWKDLFSSLGFDSLDIYGKAIYTSEGVLATKLTLSSGRAL